ncbi:MAG TPA: OmpA family protein, partial [Chitinophagales bacterium]|nr:OmpA family protein [Chitinophagales bacterium]
AEVFFRVFYSIKPGEKENTKKWDLEDKVLYNKGEYYFGQVLHRNGKYDEAIEHLNKFAKSYTPSTDKDHPDNFTKLAQLEIAGCEWAKSAPKAKVKIYNAGPGVNKSYNEGGPCGVGEDNLYYSSRKADGHNDTLVFVEGNKAKPIYEIKHSTLENGKWSEGIAVDNKDVNTDGYNVGNGAFNKAMNRFYFTKCTDMDDSRSLCNLYVADYSNGNFSNVTRLPEPINSKEKYTSTQPTVRTSDDGTETVYFVTDRPGGAGGMDIWYFTRMQSGDFRGPDPVKGTLNTVADEMTPYFDDSTKTLYFSSDGQPGLGGFDVFSSAENADLSWSDPVNVGTPVNTGADDLYYSRSNDQTNGFLVSNRVGTTPLNGIKTGGDDIFYWTNFRYAVQGLAFKEADGGGSGGALTGAVFKLYKKMPDGSKVLVSIDSSSATGKAGARGEGSYFFKLSPETDYVVEADRDGFSPKTMDVTTKGLPDEDTLNNNIVIRKAMGTIKGLVAEEGKGTGVEGASVELIEVFPNGLQQTVYYMKSNPYYAFDVEFGKNYKLVTRKEGYFANTTEVSIPASSTDTIRKDISIAKLELNKAYTLQNVLYEFGKSTLTENSKAVLDNLYQIMVENPSFIIELSSHTDGIGSDAGNMKLSQDRAQSCVDYLISKGITKDRLIAKGYGKTRPKVPNTTPDGKDDPAGRAINRRTEFSIVGLKKDQ